MDKLWEGLARPDIQFIAAAGRGQEDSHVRENAFSNRRLLVVVVTVSLPHQFEGQCLLRLVQLSSSCPYRMLHAEVSLLRQGC
jgi:hypothetical protein